MRNYFYGWYMKCASDSQTIAIIPAIHRAGRIQTCSIQIITNDNVWTVQFPSDSFHRTRQRIMIGKNHFDKNGIDLAIRTPELNIHGKLHFGPLSPLKYDIMDP